MTTQRHNEVDMNDLANLVLQLRPLQHTPLWQLAARAGVPAARPPGEIGPCADAGAAAASAPSSASAATRNDGIDLGRGVVIVRDAYGVS